MAKVTSVYKYDCLNDFLEHSNTSVKLDVLDNSYQVTAFEVFGCAHGDKDYPEGVLLYIPGITFKQLRNKT